ncbi:MAG: response regulator [Rhodoferax sp.]|nr:response regulator [Rhodoferax sp.]
MTPSSLTILVVDDLELMRRVTVTQLRGLGYEKILTASDGAAALRLIRERKVDIVLSDLNMPVMTGLELLRVIRADPALTQLPFVMITAEAERSCIQDVIVAGVTSLLVKPYIRINLQNRLEQIFASKTQVKPTSTSTGPVVLGQVKVDANLNLSPTRILVVDDNPTVLELMVIMFKDDHQVQSAADGKSALALCRVEPIPDLILIDVKMPDMDGFEVVRRLRAETATAQIPVIFVTGATDEEAQIKGMELGAVDFISKKMPPKVIQTKVKNFIKFIDMRRQLQADYDAMLEANRMREDVENINRHDLKGSLAAILSMVQVMACDDAANTTQVGQLRLLETTALHVMSMLNLSSELYNIETDRFKLTAVPVDVGQLLLGLVELARSSFAEKRLTIELDTNSADGGESLMASGDTMLCYSMLQNLLKNACEAAPPDSTVLVTIKDEHPLRILLQNKGVVPVGIRENFFEKYATSGKPGGTGIGTYSARLLALAQHGSITMDTQDNDSTTTLTVSLPRRPMLFSNPQ